MPRKKRPKKPPISRRLGDKLHAAGEFGRDSVRDPGSVPGKAHGWFRRWFRKIWKVRGGGLYALGYIVTFVWLEVTSLTGDIVDSDGVSDFLSGQAFEFVFRFASDSIVNMIQAFLWPLSFVEYRPPYGIVALVLLYLGFARFLKPPIEQWMFGDEPDEPDEPDQPDETDGDAKGQGKA